MKFLMIHLITEAAVPADSADEAVEVRPFWQ